MLSRLRSKEVILASLGVALVVGFVASLLISTNWAFFARSDGAGTATLSSRNGGFYWDVIWLGLLLVAITVGLAHASFSKTTNPRIGRLRALLAISLGAVVTAIAVLGWGQNESLEVRVDASEQRIELRKGFLFRGDVIHRHDTSSAQAILYTFAPGDYADATDVYLLDAQGERFARISSDSSTRDFDIALAGVVSEVLGLPLHCERSRLGGAVYQKHCEPRDID